MSQRSWWIVRIPLVVSTSTADARPVIAPLAPPPLEPPQDRRRGWSITLWVCWGALMARRDRVVCHLSARGDAPGDADWRRRVIKLYTVHATRGLFGLGPYSRFGWHHPGSFYFYLLAPFYVASGQHSLAISVGAYAINLTALVVMLSCLCRHAGAGISLAIIASLSTYVARLSGLVLTSAWNPHVLLLPFAAVLVLAPIVATGQLSVLPLLVLVASFVAQTHVGLVPCVVSVAACAVIVGVRASRPASPTGAARHAGFWIAVSLALLGIVWFPPVYQELTTTNGNLSQLARFFLAGQSVSSLISRADALASWSMVITAPIRPHLTLPGGAESPLIYSTALTAAAMAQIPMLWWAGWWAARRGRPLEALYCRLCALASVVALVSVARVRGGLPDHIVYWVSVIGVCNISALSAVVLLWIRAHWRVALPRVISSIVAPVAALAYVLVAAGDGAHRFQRARQLAIRHQDEPSPTASLAQATRQMLARAHVRAPRVFLAGDSWAETTGIVLQLTAIRFTCWRCRLNGSWASPASGSAAGSSRRGALANRAVRHVVDRGFGQWRLVDGGGFGDSAVG
jgi:hypothetical protein